MLVLVTEVLKVDVRVAVEMPGAVVVVHVMLVDCTTAEQNVW